MAIYEVEGEQLKLQVDSHGAELKSLKDKKTNREYMWDADPQFWPSTSPVLFPFIGRIHEQKYSYQGREYEISPHGFARDTEFRVTEQAKASITLEMGDSEETRKVYPFAFVFRVTYALENGLLRVSFQVENKGSEKMYFSLGAHPGFFCPEKQNDSGSQKRSDCFLKLEGEKELKKIRCRDVNMDTGLVLDSYTEYELQDGFLSIADDLFKNDALVLEDHQVNRVSLCGADRKPYLTLSMDAPVYGIWSSVKPGSPFICIEPWFGRCDAQKFRGTLEEREHQICLEGEEQFAAEYTVAFQR